MEKIFLCGDPHGEFDHIVSAIEKYHPQAVLILGDLTPPRSLDDIFKTVKDTPIYWIPGNHDTDTDLIYDRLWRSSYARQNLHGRVQEIGDLKVAGLGGVFRGQIWMPPAEPHYTSPSVFIRKIGKSSMWRGGLPRRHRSTIFCSICEKLKELQADILITHEAPSMHPKGFEKIDEIAEAIGAKYVFHAHQHQCIDYGNTKKGFKAKGIGLRGIIDLEGNIIVPAQVDPRDLVARKQAEPVVPRPFTKRLPASKFRRLTKGRHGRGPRRSWDDSRSRSPRAESQGHFRHNLLNRGPRRDK